MKPHDYWIFYLIGCFAALFLKWYGYVKFGQGAGRGIKELTKEWFSLKLREDQVSWATTVGVVWVLGSIYINRVTFLWEWLTAVPLDRSIAFLLGTMVEYIAPNITKWILSKMPPSA